MSAITGSGDRRTMRGRASASSSFGTATRTISQPADARAAICAVVASTSWVFVRVIDWTTTGAPPPIATPPTRIWCALAIRASGYRGRPLRPVLLAQRPHRVPARLDPEPVGRADQLSLPGVLALGDRGQLAHRDPGCPGSIGDHRDRGAGSDDVGQEPLALVPDVVVVRDRLPGLGRTVLDRRASRRLALEE